MKTTFAVVVDDSWYAGFIPFYIYFALRAYPESWVLIYFRGKLSDEIREQVHILCPDTDRFTIYEYYKPDHPRDVFTTKALRWTLALEASLIGDRLYIGDVDIMLANEKLCLFDEHDIHCDTLGLSYSNIIRNNSPRMSGLHYIQVQGYKDQMAQQIVDYDQRLKIGIARQYQNRNEKVLFEMLANEFAVPEEGSFELGYDPTKINYRPHHGVHLGILRDAGHNGKVEPGYLSYLTDFISALGENYNIENMLDKSDRRIQHIFNRAIKFAGKAV